MNRTIFVMPDTVNTSKAQDALVGMGVDKDQIHIITKQNTQLKLLEKKDDNTKFFKELLSSMTQGGVLGLVLGLICFFMVQTWTNSLELTVATLVILFGIIGAWMNAAIHFNNNKTFMRKYLSFLENGSSILVLDNTQPKIREKVLSEYPVALSESI